MAFLVGQPDWTQVQLAVLDVEGVGRDGEARQLDDGVVEMQVAASVRDLAGEAVKRQQVVAARAGEEGAGRDGALGRALRVDLEVEVHSRVQAALRQGGLCLEL